MFIKRPVLALIPARGGSKGIPRKNLVRISGRPLLSWTLEAALNSKIIDKVWLSSDDQEILEVGRAQGVNVLLRPDVLASDTSGAVVVVEHFLHMLPAELMSLDPFVVYLQPTSPLRTSIHIDAAFAQMLIHNALSSISVVELNFSPFKAFKINQNGLLQSIFDEKLSNVRRQDLQPAFTPNGAIYIFQSSEFLSRKGFPSNGSLPFIMAPNESIDIDSSDDLNRLINLLENPNG